MSAIFSMKAGQVGRIANAAQAVPFTIDFEDNRNGTFIVTEIGVRQGVNAQFLHAFDDAVYIYVFGNRIGDLTIGGLAFIEACGSGGGGSGVEKVQQYYDANKASVRRKPVLVKMGPLTFQAYLMEASLMLLRPGSGSVQFIFTFKMPPPRSRGGGDAAVNQTGTGSQDTGGLA